MLKELTPWIPFLSLVFVVLTFYRTTQKDKLERNEKEEKSFDDLKESLITLNVKLDQVNKTTTETREEIKRLNKDIADLEQRMTVVETKMGIVK